MARPEKYTALKQYINSPDGLKVIEQLAADNMTQEEIAKAIGVPATTFAKWVKENDQLYYATQRTSKLLLTQVEAKLYESAMGAKTKTVEVVTRLKKDDKGKYRLRQTEKHVYETQEAPNTKAAMWILEKRDPDRWGPKEDSTPDTTVNINVVPATSPEDEIVNSSMLPTEEELKEEMEFYGAINEEAVQSWEG